MIIGPGPVFFAYTDKPIFGSGKDIFSVFLNFSGVSHTPRTSSNQKQRINMRESLVPLSFIKAAETGSNCPVRPRC
jgi:hypothetical protein